MTAHLRDGEAPLLDPGRRLLRPRRLAVLAAAVVFAGLAVVATRMLRRPSPAQRAADLRRIAAEMLDSASPEDAARVLSDALAIHPGDAETLEMYAAAALRRGRPADAEDALRRALAANPQHSGCNVLLARVLRSVGRTAEAGPFLDRAVDGAGPDPAPRFARADARIDDGDLGGALADLRAGLDGASDAEAAARSVVAGHLADFLGRTTWSDALRTEADDFFRRAPRRGVRGRPVDASVAAEAHLCGGRPRAAAELLGPADARAGNATATVLRAEAMRLEGGHERAEVLLRDAIERTDGAPLRAALVRLLLDEGRVRSAAAAFADGLARFPGDAGILHAGAATSAAADAASHPDDLLSSALAADPARFNPMEPLFALRVAERPSGTDAIRAALSVLWQRAAGPVAASPAGAASPDGAAAFERTLQRLREAAPGDPYVRLWTGAARLRAGDADGAITALDAAVASEEFPGVAARARLVRAIARCSLGDADGALLDVRQAGAGGAPAPVVAAVESDVLVRRGDVAGARGVARRAAARWPDDLNVAAALVRALAPGSGDDGDPDAASEREATRSRVALASMDPAAVRAAVRELSRRAEADPSAARALSGAWSEAAAVWAERERASPTDAAAALGHAHSLVRAGRRLGADAVLRRALDRVADDRLTLARVRLLASMGGYDAATALLGGAIAARPDDPRLRLESAWLQIQRGDGAGADATLRRILASADVPPGTRADAALSLLTGDDVPAADATAVLAWLAATPAAALDDDVRRVLTGYARLALGAPDDAIAEAESVLGRRGTSADAAVLAARAWIVSGRPDRAEALLVRAGTDGGDRRVRNLVSHVRLVLGAQALDAGDAARASWWWEQAITGGDLDFIAAAVLADLHARAGDVGATLAIVRRVGTRPAQAAAAAMLAGHCAAVFGRDEVAFAEYGEALRADGVHAAVLTAFVGAAERTGAFDEAEAACRRAIDAGDRLGVAHALLAGVLVRRPGPAGAVADGTGDAAGRRDAAVASLRVAVARDPRNFVTMAALADLLVAAGRRDEAAGEVAAALARAADVAAPDAPDERLARLRLAVETGPVVGSIERLRDVLGGRADSWRSSFAMGRALAATGAPERALAWVERAAREAPAEFAPQAAVVRVLADLGRIDDAEQRLSARTASDPLDADAWCLLGMIADHRKHPETAEGRYRRALAVAPRHALASNELVCIVFDRPGRRDEAIGLAGAAVRARPEVPELAATHAWLLLRAGRADEAAWALDDAVRLHPSFAPIRLHRAEVALVRGQTASAVVEYRTAVRLDATVTVRASAALRDAEARAVR